MSQNAFFLLSLSIGFPFVIGLIKFNTLNRVNQVFVGYLGIGLLIEILFYWIPSNHVKLTVYNFFFLFEFMLLMILSLYWRNARMSRKDMVILLGGVGCWLLSILLFSSLHERNPAFQLYASVCICIRYLDLIYMLSLDNTLELLKDYRFLIATCLVFFHLFNFFVEGFLLWKPDVSRSFLLSVFTIKALLNCTINLLLIIPVLWMPKKPHYI